MQFCTYFSFFSFITGSVQTQVLCKREAAAPRAYVGDRSDPHEEPAADLRVDSHREGLGWRGGDRRAHPMIIFFPRNARPQKASADCQVLLARVSEQCSTLLGRNPSNPVCCSTDIFVDLELLTRSPSVFSPIYSSLSSSMEDNRASAMLHYADCISGRVIGHQRCPPC